MISIPFKSPISRYEAVAFVVGMAILTFELVAARVIAPYMGDTIYTWTSVIGVILAAMAYGYAQGGRLADKRQNPTDVAFLLLGGALLIMVVNIFKDPVLSYLSQNYLPLQLQAFMASVFLFAAPTFLIGACAPYLSRLSITDLETSGRKLSRVDAAGTIGSLAGTFMTGYFLFGLVGSSQLLSVLAAALVLTTFLLTSRKHLVLQLGILLAIVAGGTLASSPQFSGLVRDIDTAYSRYIIRDVEDDAGRIRALQTDNQGLQSGIHLDHPGQEPFAYIRNFIYTAGLQPDGRHFLIIGGGAYTFPEHLARQYPAAKVDTVEIDGQLDQISQQYFGFEQPQNLNIIAADGRQFLNRNAQRYDMIYLDAFNSIIPPFQLLTKQAAERLNSSITANGVVVANVISETDGGNNSLIHATAATMRTAFPHVAVYQLNRDRPANARQNLLLLASKQPISQDSLRRIAIDSPEFGQTLDNKLDLPQHGTLILTDNYAPVEHMTVW